MKRGSFRRLTFEQAKEKARAAPPRTSPLRQRSKKKEKEYAGPNGRAAFVKDFLRRHRTCEVGPLLWPCSATVRATFNGRERLVGTTWVWACSGRSAHVHEPLTRARGGAIDDEANSVAVCPLCHDRIHTHPDEAEPLGLLLPSTPTTAPETTT